jgi:hypothetical protein
MKNLLLAAAFAAGSIAPAMAQEFTPQRNQSATEQMQTLRTPGLQASDGSGRASGGWLPGEPASSGTFNTETSDPDFIDRSHGDPQN